MYGGNYTKYFVFVNWGGVFLGESASLLLRGWIVPVGGSTPDRRWGGGRFSALAGVERSGRGCNPRPALLPTGTPQLALPERHSSFPDLELQRDIRQGWSVPSLCRSGVQPPTGSRADRHSSTRAFKFGKTLPQSIFQTAFCHLLLCFRVGGAFRSGVQPPTGSRLGVQSPTGAGLGTTGGQDRGGAWEGGVSFLRTLAFGFPPGFFGWREFLARFRGGIL